jgi:transposase
MSLRPTSSEAVPASTAAVARAAFPRGSPYLRLRDALGPVFADQQFAALFPRHGQPAEAPWRLALVTLLQFAENLSDRRAADAVRGRIDWKYLLGLELADPGFDASVLSEFRSRLVAGGAEELLLDTLLALCREHKLLVPRGRQRTDSTHVLGAIRALNRLGCAVEALRAALNALAAAAPEWLRTHAHPAWAERYAKPADEYHIPRGEAARRACAGQAGRDGHALLAAVAAPDAPMWLRQVPVPSVALLRRVWVQNFCLLPAGADTGAGPGMGGPIEGGTVVRWRTEAEGFPTSLLMIASPYDPEAHYARKRSTTWIGYKVHLTEACDDGRPRLITHVETTPAPVVDRDALGRVHEGLAAKDLLPDAHLVDAAYVDADQLIASERGHDVALVGPTPKDQQWQARTGEGFAIRDFTLDWDRRVATCPAGHTGQSWTAGHNQGRTVMRIRFSTADCEPCALKPRCTRGARRLLTPRRREEHAALEAARMRETEEAFAAQYRRRAGIEGTLSVGVRAMHLRRSRYIGLAKTHLQHVLTAAAINLARLGAWLAGEPLARTRQSAFVRLMTQPACA